MKPMLSANAIRSVALVGIAAVTVVAQQSVPQWQIAASGTAKFDVASVRQEAPGSNVRMRANVETSGNGNFVPTGGLYSVIANLHMFVTFAYKLNPYGWYSVASQLPKWANEVNFDIEARAPGNPTKDQYRLMVQALLADRFKLAAHWEPKQMPVLAIVLEKPGKLGPDIRPHSDDVPCPAALALYGDNAAGQKTISGGFPERCGLSNWFDSGLWHIAGRNVSIADITDYLYLGPGDTPVIDKTGLKGKYDFTLKWSPEPADLIDAQPDANGPTMAEALNNQLGFKVVKAKDSVETLVIDHVEMPSAN